MLVIPYSHLEYTLGVYCVAKRLTVLHTCITMVTLQVYQQSIVHVTITSWDIPHYAAGDHALKSSGDPQLIHGAAN